METKTIEGQEENIATIDEPGLPFEKALMRFQTIIEAKNSI